VSEITLNHLYSGTQNKGHQSIGANGSFWLPPKMQPANFESSLRNFANKGRQDPAQNNTNVVENKKGSSTSSRSLIESKTSAVNPEKVPHPLKSTKHSPTLNPGMIPVSKSTARHPWVSSHPAVNSNSGSGSSPFVNISSNLSLPVLPLGMPKPDPVVSVNKFGTSPSAQYSQRSVHSGTTNASYLGSNNQKTPLTSTDAEFPLVSLSEDQAFDLIKSTFSDGFSFAVNQKGIIRFAFNLENGSSVSVRIENQKDDFKVCFISECSESLRYLSNQFSSMELEGTHSVGKSFTPMFFTSYKEMDNQLTNKPNHD